MKPKKLIRNKIVEHLHDDEWEVIGDQEELNRLYALKINEELLEIQNSNHKDILEFVDLLEVVFSFAMQNGFYRMELKKASLSKATLYGKIGRKALTNLNPDNPSNKLYFELSEVKKELKNELFSLSKQHLKAVIEDLEEVAVKDFKIKNIGTGYIAGFMTCYNWLKKQLKP